MDNIKHDRDHINTSLKNCYALYSMFSGLVESYVLDFFVCDHWNKLPHSWQRFLNEASESDLANLLDYCNDSAPSKNIWPLSFIALKTLLRTLNITRQRREIKVNYKSVFEDDPKVMKLFWRNIKLKKRHEISLMAKLSYNNAIETSCKYIVDIGSGLGHLSRLLSYGYNLKVCAFEAEEKLCEEARRLDKSFENVLRKSTDNPEAICKTVHVHLKISSNISAEEFLNIVRRKFNEDDPNFRFGIVGLHPCGDLGAVLLRLYRECKNIWFINLVSCCYMKLTTSCENQGYPLSDFSKQSNYTLSYHSREIACHAIENYASKLKEGELWKLKIHAYRAAIEKIIVSLNPSLKHSSLHNIKCTEDLTFDRYCHTAVSKLKIKLSEKQINSENIKRDLKEWHKVVAFYCTRLLFAPLIETIILLDRLLYLTESGAICEIIPAFDPLISSRNHVISSRKCEA